MPSSRRTFRSLNPFVDQHYLAVSSSDAFSTWNSPIMTCIMYGNVTLRDHCLSPVPYEKARYLGQGIRSLSCRFIASRNKRQNTLSEVTHQVQSPGMLSHIDYNFQADGNLNMALWLYHSLYLILKMLWLQINADLWLVNIYIYL